MLRFAFRRLARWLVRWQAGRLGSMAKSAIAWCVAFFAGRAALAAAPGRILPLLAQESSGEGGYAILEWAIVVVLIGVALFGICRSSRRN
jgi:hypothetical protein